MLLIVVGISLALVDKSMEDRSVSDMSGLGREFAPLDNSLPPLLTITSKKFLYCYAECNKRTDCRTFDFDSSSRQCRLWDADLTTGSIVSSPLKPQSSVGTIRLSPHFYVNVYNQSCDKCTHSRYLTCDMNTNTCQCPPKTFWDGSICLAQLLRNQTCSKVDACRSDFNLTCQPGCDFIYRCSLSKSFKTCF